MLLGLDRIWELWGSGAGSNLRSGMGPAHLGVTGNDAGYLANLGQVTEQPAP